LQKGGDRSGHRLGMNLESRGVGKGMEKFCLPGGGALEKPAAYLRSSAGHERILALFLELGCRTVAAEAGYVTLVEEGSGDLIVSAVYGVDSRGIAVGAALRSREELPGWAVTHKQTVHVHDASSDPRCSAQGLRDLGVTIRNLVCVPISVGEDALGAFVFLNRTEGSFTEADVGLMQSVSWLAGSAVSYAQLYETEQKSRRRAQTLSSFSMAITQSLEVDAVLGVLLDYLHQLVPYDRAAAMLIEWDSRFAVRVTRGDGDMWKSGPDLPFVLEAKSVPALRGLMSERKGAIIQDMRAEPAFAGWPFAEGTRSWMAIPLLASDRIIGMYALARNTPGFYSEEHLELAGTLASQASAAIQSAWLFEKVADGRARLQALSRQLVRAHEDERRAVSRELHDEAGQSLAALKVGLYLLEGKLGDSGAASAAISELREQVNDVMLGLHRLATNLRPASLDHVGLPAALRQMVDALNEREGNRIAFTEDTLEGGRFSEFTETALYRIAQEALGNAVRHSMATRVSVVLKRAEGKITLRVEDDGAGFDPVLAQECGRLGLMGMRERAEMLGGSLRVQSVEGSGTTILAEVPDADSGSSG